MLKENLNGIESINFQFRPHVSMRQETTESINFIQTLSELSREKGKEKKINRSFMNFHVLKLTSLYSL